MLKVVCDIVAQWIVFQSEVPKFCVGKCLAEHGAIFKKKKRPIETEKEKLKQPSWGHVSTINAYVVRLPLGLEINKTEPGRCDLAIWYGCQHIQVANQQSLMVITLYK